MKSTIFADAKQNELIDGYEVLTHLVQFPLDAVELLYLLCAKAWCTNLIANKLANRTAAEIATVNNNVLLDF
jgi:hypothetical protein